MAKVSMTSLLNNGPESAPAETATETPPRTPENVTVTKSAAIEHPEPPQRRPSDRTKVVKRLATVYTPQTVYNALSRHVKNQRAKGELLSYGVVVLLAVEKHATELATLWNDTEAPASTGGLFDVQVRKAAPKKVPWQLHGATPQQIRKLDDIAAEWNAPNRSVLVEEALVRYLGR